MKVNLLTDAPKHNLALMKISAWHKARGDSIFLNFALMPADKTYASWIFDWSIRFRYDIGGGPGLDPGAMLSEEIEAMKPDYLLYPDNDYSLGYTWRACPRKCSFCKVKDMWQEKEHHSIWDFHDSKFKKICLLNNNTFMDPQWKETFREIWDSDLIVHDENGYDLRLLDEEKGEALKRTKFDKDGAIHYAWDNMKDEKLIIEGLKIINKLKLTRHAMVYVLVGYNTTFEEDLYRCQKIADFKCDPFIMVYNADKRLKRFANMINQFVVWRKYKTIKEAWENYK